MKNIINKINQLDGVAGKIIVKSGSISLAQKSLNLHLIADFTVSVKLVEQIEKLILSELPSTFKLVNCSVEKVVTDKDFVLKSVSDFLFDSHKAICGFVDTAKSEFVKNGYDAAVKIYVDSTCCAYVKEKQILQEIKEDLESNFVENFTVTVCDNGSCAADTDLLEAPVPAPTVFKRQPRTLKVDDVTRLFDNDDNRVCTYISDSKEILGEAYFAGTITRIEERKTKTDKSFYIIEINDRTASISGMVFPSKDKLPKMLRLEVGTEIIVRGEFAMRGEYRNFTIKSINLCTFPTNFVPQERQSRPCPENYTVVFPKPMVVETQDNFLEQKTIPECFIGREFVVFDLETTGIEHDDKITEIGAVRLIDGVVTEYFSTLINPQKNIPQEVQDLTGITNEMVKDAPTFEQVCGDFFKFCKGTTLVAHNIEFDSRFIKNQGAAIDYYFDNPLMDTLFLARETLKGMSNYKLNTLCDKFGIKFNHHRAYADAYATSQLFVEIIRKRGDLPF